LRLALTIVLAVALAAILWGIVKLIVARPALKNRLSIISSIFWRWCLRPFRPGSSVEIEWWAFCTWMLVISSSVGIPITNALFGLSLLGGHEFWVTWEYVGLGSTIVFAMAMGGIWFFGDKPINDQLTSFGTGCFLFFLIVATGLVAAALLATVYKWSPPVTAFFLAAASFFFVQAQYQILQNPKPEMQADRNYLETRQDASNTLRFSDIPTFWTFSFLFLFEIVAAIKTDGQIELLHAFISGAISFQLLISNMIFGANYAFRKSSEQVEGI
jgi:hypothetical protein